MEGGLVWGGVGVGLKAVESGLYDLRVGRGLWEDGRAGLTLNT